MTENSSPEMPSAGGENTDQNLFQDAQESTDLGPRLDPSELFDFEPIDLVDLEDRAEANNFGQLSTDFIPQASTGVQRPELTAPLEESEIAFALPETELHQIVATLDVLFRHLSNQSRRCRLTIDNQKLIWHANYGNAFIEYISHDFDGNITPRQEAPHVVAFDFADFVAAAAATKGLGTFRITGKEKDRSIEFTSEGFSRPLALAKDPHDRKFSFPTDKRLALLDDVKSSEFVPSDTLHSALTFVGKLATNHPAEQRFEVVELKNGVCRSISSAGAATAASKLFQDLDFSFRPHFLRLILPALKLSPGYRFTHASNFCVALSDHKVFGFEVIEAALPETPKMKADGIVLLPRQPLIKCLLAAARTFGEEDTLIELDYEKIGSQRLHLRCYEREKPQRLMLFDTVCAFEGEIKSSFKSRLDFKHLFHALRQFESPNVVMEIVEKNGIGVRFTEKLEEIEYLFLCAGVKQ